jgi:homoaconitase/3-isopropylmalate dehydratase large subunit
MKKQTVRVVLELVQAVLVDMKLTRVHHTTPIMVWEVMVRREHRLRRPQLTITTIDHLAVARTRARPHPTPTTSTMNRVQCRMKAVSIGKKILARLSSVSCGGLEIEI